MTTQDRAQIMWALWTEIPFVPVSWDFKSSALLSYRIQFRVPNVPDFLKS